MAFGECAPVVDDDPEEKIRSVGRIGDYIFPAIGMGAVQDGGGQSIGGLLPQFVPFFVAPKDGISQERIVFVRAHGIFRQKGSLTNSCSDIFNDSGRSAIILYRILNHHSGVVGASCFWPIGNTDEKIWPLKILVSLTGGAGRPFSGFGGPPRNVNGLLTVGDRFAGSPPERRSESPQSSGRDGQPYGSNSNPPFSSQPQEPPMFRVLISIGMCLGSNFVLLIGFHLLDKGRRIGGGMICSLAVGMFFGSALVMFSIGVPATWGWWV